MTILFSTGYYRKLYCLLYYQIAICACTSWLYSFRQVDFICLISPYIIMVANISELLHIDLHRLLSENVLSGFLFHYCIYLDIIDFICMLSPNIIISSSCWVYYQRLSLCFSYWWSVYYPVVYCFLIFIG